MRINRLRRRESITLLGCAVAVETRVTHPADAIRAGKQSYCCTAANGGKVPSKAASAKSHSMTSSAAAISVDGWLRRGTWRSPRTSTDQNAHALHAAAKLVKRCARWFTSGCLYVSRDRHNQRSEKRWRSRKNGRPNGGPGTKALRLGNGTRSRQRK